ncbi:MAG: YkgJ family cysteine cluster protein [Gammaproteobacteria bacterium]|nr:MAG: YkgJ family cysteine cluster protein [Gammaproteobacteria bacterium]RKZ39713.1 MAG: YkgJ family cysteine cluster protein [Gammaproteobacteria bacterium]RKZ75549.1 MAG: YkgJ family cysteine cluster protein [Gammaproteobacteria bacterium]
MSDSPLENIPHQSSLQPVELFLDDTIQFRCHKNIACFNECCKRIDISLTPYDILRLKNRLELTSNEFLAQYTVPYEMDASGMPGVKIRTADDNLACPFLSEKGCSVYDDRPTVCRYYALGLMSMRKEKSPTDEDAYFLIKEEHCLGHNESRTITVGDYRKEQDVAHYDEMNREWLQIILKKRSSGPTIGKPSARSFQFFFLGSYNLDSFRNFVKSEGFSNVYDLTAKELEQLKTDDVALLQFGFRLLKQVLFGEMSIAVKSDAMQKRTEQRREQINVDPDNPNQNYDGPGMI